jgi:heme/copper-type cytochrome/quinol oxidase subunit 4
MKDFPVNILCELICFIVALVCYFKKRQFFIAAFAVYLGITLFLEIVSFFADRQGLSARVYNNVLNILGLFFYSYFMLPFFYREKEKRIVKLLLVVYSIYWFYEVLNSKMIDKFDMPIWVISWLVQILLCLLYFKLYLQTNINENVNYYNTAFYIAMGLFVFCFGSIVVVAFASEIKAHNLKILNIPLHQFIIRLLCIPLYGFISLALLKWKPLQITTSILS